MKEKLRPTRLLERETLDEAQQQYGLNARVGGVDEVGRGSLAGPVSVGISVIDHTTSDSFPVGLRDSKMLSPMARERIEPECRKWSLDIAVGHAGPEAVDELGIIGALRAAAAHAFMQLEARGTAPDTILLDGVHNWWSQESLLDVGGLPDLPVRMQVKGDATCAVIASASVVAKVERDKMMVELDGEYPGYDWGKNKGYSSAHHIDGLRRLGASTQHRRSWNLPGIGASHNE